MKEELVSPSNMVPLLLSILLMVNTTGTSTLNNVIGRKVSELLPTPLPPPMDSCEMS